MRKAWISSFTLLAALLSAPHAHALSGKTLLHYVAYDVAFWPKNMPVSAENFVKNGQYFAQKVYFDFNRSEVRPSERPKLEALANHLQSNPTFGVVIEGHCDDRGSDEYNRSLSERRSLAVKDYLVSLGIAADRMRTVSYGEDRPDVPNARTEQEHQLNRRAQFLVGAIR